MSLLGTFQHLDNGDLADLRRWRPDRERALPPAFWRLYVQYGNEEDPNTWALIFTALAITQGQRGSTRLGSALQAAKFSEDRLARLLNAPEDRRADAVLKMAGILAAQKKSFNAQEMIAFIRNPTEAARHRIAQAYYSTQNKSEQETK